MSTSLTRTPSPTNVLDGPDRHRTLWCGDGDGTAATGALHCWRCLRDTASCSPSLPAAPAPTWPVPSPASPSPPRPDQASSSTTSCTGKVASLRRGAKSSRPDPVQRPGFQSSSGLTVAVPGRARGEAAVGLACATRSRRRCPDPMPSPVATGGRAGRAGRQCGPGAWRVPTSGAGVDGRVPRGEGDMVARAACSGLVSLTALDSLLGGRDRVRGTRARRYPVQRPPHRS